MQSQFYRSYILVAIAAAVMLSLPLAFAERIRGFAVTALWPMWSRVQYSAISQNGRHQGDLRRPLTLQEHVEFLELQNLQLQNEVVRLTELLTVEQGLYDQLSDIETVEGLDEILAQRRKDRLRLLELKLQSISARVVLRSATSWNSFLWLDVGEADNQELGRKVIAKNSPVLVGSSLVGVVDVVNLHQTRVRLITDPGFNPSVRAVRGDAQRQELLEHLDIVAAGLAHDEGLFYSSEERGDSLNLMLDLRERLKSDPTSWHLAKGELNGSSLPLWRRRGNIIRGVGFNYDFADDEGPSRDLITGRVIGCDKEEKDVVILQVDDLLITTGLDGILIPGLHVARVTKVYPLAEGDYFYEVEAQPTVGNLDAISLVSVLPPSH